MKIYYIKDPLNTSKPFMGIDESSGGYPYWTYHLPRFWTNFDEAMTVFENLKRMNLVPDSAMVFEVEI